MKGFTLIEILLVTLLVSLIIGFSSYWYYKLQQSSFIIDESASMIVNVLNLAKQKAILGEENDSWGVLLINNSTNPDYLNLFKGTINSIKENFVLPGQIDFIDPPINSSKTILFKKLTGETTSTVIQIKSINSSLVRSICVSTSGTIYTSSTCP